MYKIRNESEILLYDSIEQGMTAQKLLRTLAVESDEEITLRINSSGGDVFEALAVYNWLRGHEYTVNVYVDGICASAASIIAMAGNNIYMPRNAMMMIHNPVGSVYGDSQDFKDMAGLLDRIRDSIADIYAGQTGLDREKIIELMDAETWMNGDEAYSLGFCDEVIEPVKNKADPRTYDDGVKDERARLKDLDELMSMGREELIARAKYETFQTASEIAVDLLKLETRRQAVSRAVEGITAWAECAADQRIDMMAAKINMMRGRK